MDKKINDVVNHPAHYNTGKYESIDVMIETQGAEAVKNFCICNAFKYIYRHRNKNGLEDIKKAIWYLNKYVELEESKSDKSQIDCDTCKWKDIADDIHCGLCGYAGIDNYVPQTVNLGNGFTITTNDCDTCKHNIDEDEGDYDIYCEILAVEGDCRYEPIDTVQGTGDCNHCSRLFVDCSGR